MDLKIIDANEIPEKFVNRSKYHEIYAAARALEPGKALVVDPKGPLFKGRSAEYLCNAFASCLSAGHNKLNGNGFNIVQRNGLIYITKRTQS